MGKGAGVWVCVFVCLQECVSICVCVCVCVKERERVFVYICAPFISVDRAYSATWGRCQLYLRRARQRHATRAGERGRGRRSEHGLRICEYMCICPYEHENTPSCMSVQYSLYIRWPTCLLIWLRFPQLSPNDWQVCVMGVFFILISVWQDDWV